VNKFKVVFHLDKQVKVGVVLTQHFSLYTVKPMISLVSLPISKVYQIRSYLTFLSDLYFC